MSDVDVRLPQHGRDHRVVVVDGVVVDGGSDPIAGLADLLNDSGGGGLQFNAGTYGPANVGDWLYIETTGSDGSTDGFGAKLVLSSGLEIISGDDVTASVDGRARWSLNPGSFFFISSIDRNADILEVDDDGTVFWYTGGSNYFIYTQGGAQRFVTEGGEWLAETEGGNILLDASGVTGGNGSDIVSLAAGQTFEVRDSVGNPKLRWTEGTNDLYIPTGGTVIASL